MLPTRAWQDWVEPTSITELQATMQKLEERIRRLERRQRNDRRIFVASCVLNVATIVMLVLSW